MSEEILKEIEGVISHGISIDQQNGYGVNHEEALALVKLQELQKEYHHKGISDKHIAQLERQNHDLQVNNTKLLLDNRLLRGECAGGLQAFTGLVEDKRELEQKLRDLDGYYKASLNQIRNLCADNRRLKAAVNNMAFIERKD